MGFMPSFPSLSLQVLAVLSTAIQPGHASPAIAAWWTEVGPQVLVQNLTTAAIQYSSCNSNNTPIYPVDQPNVLPTSSQYKPKNGTALSGVGWWAGNTTTASLFYQSELGQIINGLFQCDWSTGQFINQGSWVISGNSPSVNDQTGLASILLGSTAGYRVYFHDENQAVNEIGYASDSGWDYRQMVSPDHPDSTAIHAAFTGKSNVSVVFPRDSENFEVSRFNSDTTWHISTFPRPLAGKLVTNTNSNASTIKLNSTAPVSFALPYYGTPKGVGITIDSASTRYVWYIGTDRNLYSAANVGSSAWGLNSNSSTVFWPQADEPNAPLGVTSDSATSQIRIYYYVKGLLTEIKLDQDGSWQQAQALPTSDSTTENASPNTSTASAAEPTSSDTGSSSGSSTDSSSSSSSSLSSGLSSGAKAGVGIGVTLGLLAVAGVLGALYFLRRRRARQQQEAAPEAPEMEQTAELDPNHKSGAAAGAAYDAHGSPTSYDPRHAATPDSYVGGSPSPPGYAWDQKMPQQLESVECPQELEGPRTVYELPEQTFSYELGDGRVGAELPGDVVPRGNGGAGAGVHGAAMGR